MVFDLKNFFLDRGHPNFSQISQNEEVFTFAKNGQLKMGFSPRWEVILREVKQVAALNLRVSSTVEAHCAKGRFLAFLSNF